MRRTVLALLLLLTLGIRPAEAQTAERFVSDLAPGFSAPTRLDADAATATADGALTLGAQTYAKGLGMAVTGGTAVVSLTLPEGCTGLAATIGHDNNSPGTTLRFRVLRTSPSFVEFYKLDQVAKGTTAQVSVALTPGQVLIELAGNGMGNWADARFTGCPAPPTPTPVPPTATPVPPTATPLPPTPTPSPVVTEHHCPSGFDVEVSQAATVVRLTCAQPAVPTPEPTATSTPEPPPPPSGMTHGVFDDANHQTASSFDATISDLQARGFGAILLTNGSAAKMGELLPVADAKGFAVYSGPIHELYGYYNDSAATPADAEARLGAVIDSVKGHPSHRGWYIADEPGLGWSDKLQAVAAVIRNHDPGKPVTAALIGVDRVEPIGTAMGADPWLVNAYPAAAGNAECDFTMRGFGYQDRDFAQYVTEVSDGRPAGVPLYLILQAHSFDSGGFSLRLPTQQEMRAQVRLAEQQGAEAIFWFLYSSIGPPLGPGLVDNPPLYDEAERIASGTQTGPACEAGAPTSTPTPPAAPTPTPTPQPPPPTGAGVPGQTIQWGEGVESFWARHWANPASASHVAQIPDVQPVVTVQAGQDLQAAIDALPATGGTLLLRNGVYGRASIIGRSNVHLRGESRDGVRVRGITVASCQAAISYTAFNEAIQARDAASLQCATNRHRNFAFKHLTFDGQGDSASWHIANHLVTNNALMLRTVRDVAVEDASFVNYGGAGSSAHTALVAANYLVDNIWGRRLELTADTGMQWFADGCHGCGLLDSHASYAAQGAIAYFVNDDATDDRYPEDGIYQPHELRLSNYTVLQGNTIDHNNAFAINHQGAHALIRQNRTTGFHSDFVYLQNRYSLNHPGEYYYEHYGHRIYDNTVQQALRLVRWDEVTGIDPATNPAYPRVGDYEIRDNHVLDANRFTDVLLKEFPPSYPWTPPETVQDNTVGG